MPVRTPRTRFAFVHHPAFRIPRRFHQASSRFALLMVGISKHPCVNEAYCYQELPACPS